MEKNDESSWSLKPEIPTEKRQRPHGFPFSLDKKNLAAKSAKVSAMFKQNPQVKFSSLLQAIPADTNTLELVVRFCRGFEPDFSSENVIPLICLANYLEMTETQSKNNLLKRVLTFFQRRVLPSWDETIKALRSVGSYFQQAASLGLLEACLKSLVGKAQINPHLLVSDRFENLTRDEDEGEDYRPNARPKLFGLSWESEDLTTLPIQLYQPIILAMNQHQIPPECVAASVCKYAEKWVSSGREGSENLSVYRRNSQRDVIEAVESLLPNQKGLVPCGLLFKLLRIANFLESSDECRSGFEGRIGKQLEQATVRDLLEPCQGYAKEMQYDMECLNRIVKHFYSNCSKSDSSGLITVAELFEEFIVELASDKNLKIDTFIELGKMSITLSSGTKKNCDPIYRAIDIYLDKHRCLTEHETDEICRILDCHNLSPEAFQHVTNNDRLPLRFKVQMLFVWQLQMRNSMANQVQVSREKLRQEGADEDEEKEARELDFEEEKVRTEMEKMSIKVMELERECCIMRKEIQNGCRNQQKVKKGKISMWKEMKRKFGCISGDSDCNCQVKKKKVHPKY